MENRLMFCMLLQFLWIIRFLSAKKTRRQGNTVSPLFHYSTEESRTNPLSPIFFLLCKLEMSSVWKDTIFHFNEEKNLHQNDFVCLFFFDKKNKSLKGLFSQLRPFLPKSLHGRKLWFSKGKCLKVHWPLKYSREFVRKDLFYLSIE